MRVGAVSRRVLIVTAADSRFRGLLQGMLASIEPILARPGVDLACFDIGLDAADRAWLAPRCAAIKVPGAHFGLRAEDHKVASRSFLARPFLPSYFPGYDIYVWIDSDVWLQRPTVVDTYISCAARFGMALSHEGERAYRLQAWLLAWTGKHFVKGYGPVTGLSLLMRRHLNAGFFAAAHDAPHWQAWASRYETAIRRSGRLTPHDQFALVQAIHTGGHDGAGRLPTALLDPDCNWICDRGVPMWNDALGVFCKPYAPYAPIGAMHLAGPAKTTEYLIHRTGGGSFTTFLTQGASPATPVRIGPLEPSVTTERLPELQPA